MPRFDASADNASAPASDDSPTNHPNASAVLVHQTHRVTASGVETSTTLTTPDESGRITDAVADQLHLAFDVSPSEHGLTVHDDHATTWSYADHALTRLDGGDNA